MRFWPHLALALLCCKCRYSSARRPPGVTVSAEVTVEVNGNLMPKTTNEKLESVARQEVVASNGQPESSAHQEVVASNGQPDSSAHQEVVARNEQLESSAHQEVVAGTPGTSNIGIGGQPESSAHKDWRLWRRSDGLGPPWLNGDMPKPAGEKNMGSWTAVVFTAEQQAELHCNEWGEYIGDNAGGSNVKHWASPYLAPGDGDRPTNVASLTPELASRIFVGVDCDKDLTLNFIELILLSMYWRASLAIPQKLQHQIHTSIPAYDMDEDGKLSIAEFSSWFKGFLSGYMWAVHRPSLPVDGQPAPEEPIISK